MKRVHPREVGAVDLGTHIKEQDDAQAAAAAIAAGPDPVDTMLAILRAGLAEQSRNAAGFEFDTTSNSDLFVAHGIVDLRELAARIVRGGGR